MERNLDHVDIEFKELIKIDDGDSGYPQDFDIMHPMPQFCAATDDLEKLFAPEQELQKRDVVRSRMEPTRNTPQENKAEPQSVEEFFGVCEKRSSDPHKIKLTKRLVDGEILVEGWNVAGECVYSRTDKAGNPIDESSPLAKASITSSMFKTLELIRSALTADELEAAAKAIKSLDIDAFLQICRRAQAAA